MSRTEPIFSYPPLHNLSNAERILGGETGAILYRIDDRVIKLATDELGLPEVRNNIKGYQGLIDAGASSIVPADTCWGDERTHAWIDMPDLGQDMAQRDLLGIDLHREYGILTDKIKDLALDTARHDDEQRAGIIGLQSQIAEWAARLAGTYPNLLEEVAERFIKSDFEKSASDISTVMIQDFTPDNVFVQDAHVSFIDPWPQQTYRGSLIPSISQYYTNAAEVRQLPSAVQSAQKLQEIITYLGDIMDLSDAQVAVQCEMGRTLQYILSSFVRIHTDPRKSYEYAVEAANGLREIMAGLEEL